MIRDKRQQAGLLWILLNIIQVPDVVHAKGAPFCFKESSHHNVMLRGGLEAGEYTPWEPSDVSIMTPETCTEHCCQSPDTDVVFLLNSYCFCVKCRSIQLCSPVKITPPSGYNPVTVTVVKSISKLSTTAKPPSYSGIFTRTKATKSSTQSTTAKSEQKETDRGTKEPEDVTTKSAETTSDSGLRRRTGEDANLEIKNSHLPVPNGYSAQTKDGPKSGAVASYTGVSSEAITTTANIGMNFTTPYISSTVPTTPRPTRVVKAEKKAEGTGNDDISLQCPGSLKVIRVGAFGISGDNKTVEDFDKHCQANLALVDKTKVCIVSLKRVYKSTYPPFIKTLVTYTCSYTEFIS